MVEGKFFEDTPLIPITIGWDHGTKSWAAILDTGFSGDLQITPEIAQELGIAKKSIAYATMADGKVAEIPMGIAVVALEDTKRPVRVLISAGTVLAGIGLLTKFGYKAIVDCKHKKVALQKA